MSTDPNITASESYEKAHNEYWNLPAEQRAKQSPPDFAEHLERARGPIGAKGPTGPPNVPDPSLAHELAPHGES